MAPGGEGSSLSPRDRSLVLWPLGMWGGVPVGGLSVAWRPPSREPSPCLTLLHHQARYESQRVQLESDLAVRLEQQVTERLAQAQESSLRQVASLREHHRCVALTGSPGGRRHTSISPAVPLLAPSLLAAIGPGPRVSGAELPSGVRGGRGGP